MYFNLNGLFEILLATLVLIIAHVIWLIQLARKFVWEKKIGRGLMLIPLAAITPLVSFYIAMIVIPLPRQRSTEDALWRWLMPALGFGTVTIAAVRTDLRYAPSYRSLSGTIEAFWPLAICYILVAAIAYMAVFVSGKTLRNPFTSHTQFIAIAFVLWLAFAY